MFASGVGEAKLQFKSPSKEYPRWRESNDSKLENKSVGEQGGLCYVATRVTLPSNIRPILF